MESITYQTIAEMFGTVTKKYAAKVGYRYKEGGVWKDITFAEMREKVEKVGSGLKSIGLKTNDKVSIVSQNSPWWAMTDYSVLTARGVMTSIYPTLTPKQIKWIVQHSESRYIFTGDPEQTDKVLSFVDELKSIVNIISLSDYNPGHHLIITLTELMERGEQYRIAHPDEFEQEINAIRSDDLMTLIYTSGTTGEPKGVMLTHNNLISNIWGGLQVLDADHTDVFLSFLPLSHSFERMAGHYLATSIGATICYAENINTVADNMREVHPTLMTAVPRFYEKVYAKIINSIADGPAIKRKLFWWAIGIGKKYNQKKDNGEWISPWLNSRRNLANKLVFHKLHERIGGRLRFFVSGGAPLSKEIGEFFRAAGILILEGYGLTETSPVISITPLERIKIGYVGIPIPNVEVKIASDGEILTRGPHIMKGYFKDEAATKEVISEDGWFSTGDIGELDSEGFLKITDRKKNILVTSGGKNVAPQPMENVLISSKWIEQVMAIGDKRKFVSAIIVPSFANLEDWAKERGLPWNSREELIKLPEVQALYEREVSEHMESFAQFEKVKKFVLLPQEFTIESGELTPKMSIKRDVVEKRLAALIDSMYLGNDN